jgi:hypothetical protein
MTAQRTPLGRRRADFPSAVQPCINTLVAVDSPTGMGLRRTNRTSSIGYGHVTALERCTWISMDMSVGKPLVRITITLIPRNPKRNPGPALHLGAASGQ